MMRKYIFIVLSFLVFCSGCGEGSKKPLAVGDQAPDFKAVTLSGETIHLSDWKGKPVVLRFWSTDCKYCRADTPVFNHYFSKYKDKGLRVLYVNTDSGSIEEVQTFVRDLDIVFPVMTKGGEALGAQYNVKIVPQTIFIAPDGTILSAILGGVGDAEFSEILGNYL